MALIGRELGSSSLQRHYATLSSIGDLDFSAENNTIGEPMQWLNDGGFGPTLVEQFESFDEHAQFRKVVELQMKTFKSNRLHLEAFLAARWFEGKHRDSVLDCAPLNDRETSFIDKLLAKASNSGVTAKQGTLFEAAAGLVLSTTPGFTIDSAREETDSQIDLVFRFQPDKLFPFELPTSFGLVECKHHEKNVGAKDIRDFGAKCLFNSVKIGVLVAKKGLTGGKNATLDQSEITHAKLARRRWLQQGVTLLTVSEEDLKVAQFNLRGLGDALYRDWKQLVIGQVAGSDA